MVETLWASWDPGLSPLLPPLREEADKNAGMGICGWQLAQSLVCDLGHVPTHDHDTNVGRAAPPGWCMPARFAPLESACLPSAYPSPHLARPAGPAPLCTSLTWANPGLDLGSIFHPTCPPEHCRSGVM